MKNATKQNRNQNYIFSKKERNLQTNQIKQKSFWEDNQLLRLKKYFYKKDNENYLVTAPMALFDLERKRLFLALNKEHFREVAEYFVGQREKHQRTGIARKLSLVRGREPIQREWKWYGHKEKNNKSSF